MLQGVVSSHQGGVALSQPKYVDSDGVGSPSTHTLPSSIISSEVLSDALRNGLTSAMNANNPDIVPEKNGLSELKVPPAPDPPDYSDLGAMKQAAGVDANKAPSRSALKKLRKQARGSSSAH